jgi:SAM-dependent methyltransferase
MQKLELSGYFKRFFLLFILSFASLLIRCQDQTKSNLYVPYVGQPGKDVIWVPTPFELVDKMLELAGVTDTDYVVDLGSGDGRTVIAAAKLGAHALGIEYNADMVEVSKKKSEEAGVSINTKFVQADLFVYDLSKATVITMFLLPDINLKLRPRLLDLKPGTRIVSNTFSMGNWEPDSEATTDGNLDSWYTALLWIIPAKIEGVWNLGSGLLNIYQEFQMIYGTLKTDDKISILTEGRLNGDKITFSVDGAKYSGRVTGKSTMEGTADSGSGKRDWTATR